ncbi:DUF2577 domain-containing protein [Bacillus tianshenii]|nr:DUF2577 domain-containing protein [Bacillus tianshenii]
MNDSITEFAKMFKERDNPVPSGIQIGEVLAPFPEIKIKLNEKVVLGKEELVFSESLLNTYKREVDIKGQIQLSDTDSGTTDSVNDGGQGASSHSHTIRTLDVDTAYTAKAELLFTDTLVAGDSVIIFPAADEQTYYVMDKAVRL